MKIIENMKRLFKPTSPLQDLGQSASKGGEYSLDLTLQNLLAIGSEFTPDDIIQLRRRARYGDPRWLYSLYDEMQRLGPAPQVLKAREAIKGTETLWHATPEEADEDETSTEPGDKVARLVRDVTEEAWGKWVPDLKDLLSKKHFYGLACVQVMWNPKAIEGKWSRVTDIRPIPARRFRLDPETLRFKLLTNPYTWDGPFVDDLQKTGKLIFVETGADEEPLDQRGLFFQCLLPWAIEQFTVRWRAKRLQNFGMPPVMVTYPKGDPSNKATADELAAILASGTRASLPDGMKAELLSAVGGGKGGDPYEVAIEWCARQYDQIILGHSQVSGVQQGAGSRTSSHDAVGLFKDVTNSRARDWDKDFRQQATHPYVSREFGADVADEHCPVTDSRVVERDNPVELAGVIFQLTQAGLGGVIAAEDAVRRCTLKVAEDGELTAAGNIKGEHPAPAEVDAFTKANPQPQAVQLDHTGKPLGNPGLPPTSDGKGGMLPGEQGKVKMLPPAPVQPGQKLPGKGGAPIAAKKGMPFTKAGGKFMDMGDFQPPADAPVVKGKRKKVIDVRAKRERFRTARFGAGGKPRIHITSFGHEHGAPTDTHMNFDVRGITSAQPYDAARTGRDPGVARALEADPSTGRVYHGVKMRAKQAISDASLLGDHELKLGVGCEHGKHRGPYVAERLGRDLRAEGHDVTVQHRDAEDVSKSGPRGIAKPNDDEIGLDQDPENQLFDGLRQLAQESEGGLVNVRVSAGPDGEMRFWTEEQHPRDDHGRWTDGGDSTLTGGTKDHGVEWHQPVDANGRPIPIKVEKMKEAIALVLQGKVVELPDVRHVNTLLDKLGKMARDAEKAGEKAPNFDLCNVTVPGTNLFCADKLRTAEQPQGIPRIEMPQLGGTPVAGSAADLLAKNSKGEVDGGAHFMNYMAGLGYGVKNEVVSAASLKASQSELVGAKVAGMMRKFDKNPDKLREAAIFVSRDNYIVDGHHRWAAVVGLDTKDGKLTASMKVHRIDAPITEVLRLANKWSQHFGIAQKSGKLAAQVEGEKFATDRATITAFDFLRISPSALKMEAKIAARMKRHLEAQKRQIAGQ